MILVTVVYINVAYHSIIFRAIDFLNVDLLKGVPGRHNFTNFPLSLLFIIIGAIYRPINVISQLVTHSLTQMPAKSPFHYSIIGFRLLLLLLIYSSILEVANSITTLI